MFKTRLWSLPKHPFPLRPPRSLQITVGQPEDVLFLVGETRTEWPS